MLSGCLAKKEQISFCQIHRLNQLSKLIENSSKNDLVIFDFDKVLIPKWGQAFSTKAFDAQMSETINEIKKSGAIVGGLTKRIPVRLKRLDRALTELDTEFNWLDGCQESFLTGQRFHHGVFFVCPWASKGQCLKQLFLRKSLKNQPKPSRIIFVDDSAGNLESVQRFCTKNKIEFMGILYKA